MMKNVFFIFLCVAGWPAWSAAQEITVSRKTETVPDFAFRYVNHDQADGRLSDYRGQVLILYFWNVHCNACLASFPKLEALNAKYHGRLTILPVVRDLKAPDEKYPDFYRMREKRGLKINLPSAIADSSLLAYFPHTGLPHLVWIDGQGRVLEDQAAAGSLKEEYLDQVLAGKPVSLPLKTTAITREHPFDRSKPYLVEGNGGTGTEFIYRSVLGPDNPNIRGGGNLYYSKDSTYTRLFAPNITLTNLYLSAYWRAYPDNVPGSFAGRYGAKGLHLETSRPVPGLTGNERTYFCYELILPPGYTEVEMYRKVIADLDRMLGVRSELTKRRIAYYRLQLADDTVRCATKFPDVRGMSKVFDEPDSSRLWITNVTMSGISSLMNSSLEIGYVDDQTNCNDRIDLDIRIPKKCGLDHLKFELEKYGFLLIPVERPETILVIQDL